MNDGNAQSLIFILFFLIFILAPPLLKLLGKYTLESKKSEQPPQELHPDEGPYPPEISHVDPHSVGPTIDNKPIEPRWF